MLNNDYNQNQETIISKTNGNTIYISAHVYLQVGFLHYRAINIYAVSLL